MAKKTKLQILKAKPQSLFDYVNKAYYGKIKPVPAVKPLVRTKDANKVFDKARQANFQRQFDSFPVEHIDSTIKTREHARNFFDKVIYPVKVIIPKSQRKKLGGIQEMIFKTYKGERNCIRYYTKNKFLTDEQCTVLYLDEDIRSVHGFLINDKQLTDSNLMRYLAKVTEIEEKGNAKLAQKIGGLQRKADVALRAISLPVKTNPDGSRKPSAIQMGLNSYMERNKLKNPTGIIDSHVKKEKLKIYDLINLGAVLNEINVTPKEAFDYVCSYLNKNNSIKRIHTEDRELYRGATALGNLIDFYKAEERRTTLAKLDNKKVKKYTHDSLMKSPEYAKYCKQAEVTPIRVLRTFSKWFSPKLDIIKKLNKK